MRTLTFLDDALFVLRDAECDESGETYARILHDHFSRRWGSDHELTIEYGVMLAHFLVRRDRLDEAEPLLDALLAREATLTSVARRSDLHLVHGAFLTRRGRFEEAGRGLDRALALHGEQRDAADDGARARLERAFAELDRARAGASQRSE